MTLKAILSLPILISLTGCASIINGGSQNVQIQSTPQGANVAITAHPGSSVFNGTTPCTASLKRGAGYMKGARYHVHITKSGYAPMDVEINSSLSGWYFGNFAFGGLIGLLAVDPATGAMWSLDPETVSVSLRSKHASFFPKGAEGLHVVLRKEVPAELSPYLKPLPSKS
jgi:hypothetical protein